MGGKESMVRQKLKEIGDVLRQQVVGDFHVAEVQQGAIRGTVVSFIPTAGRSGSRLFRPTHAPRGSAFQFLKGFQKVDARGSPPNIIQGVQKL
jgi:hypothetical protein